MYTAAHFCSRQHDGPQPSSTLVEIPISGITALPGLLVSLSGVTMDSNCPDSRLLYFITIYSGRKIIIMLINTHLVDELCMGRTDIILVIF
jgi:hypothetical protein